MLAKQQYLERACDLTEELTKKLTESDIEVGILSPRFLLELIQIHIELYKVVPK